MAIAFASTLGRQLLPAPILGRRRDIDSHKRSMLNASVRTPAIIASPKYPRHLNCPRCGLSILVRPHRAAIGHCPRCVGRSRVIVELFSSTLPADVLYDENSLPRVDGELARSYQTSSSMSTPRFGERHQRAQAVDNVRRAEPLALVAKRPVAIRLSAIGERAASPRSRPRLATCPSRSPAGRTGRAEPETGKPARGMVIPRKHPGMEVACALLAGRELHTPMIATSSEPARSQSC